MPDLKDFNNLYLIAVFIVPGLIISYMRAQFVSGKLQSLSDAALAYLVLSIIYYGISVPFVIIVISLNNIMIKLLLWWMLIIVGPAAFGVALGVARQHEWILWLAKKVRLRIVHGTPTSWDWRFGNCVKARFVLVTLTDGSTVAGIFGTGSSASTDPSERDICIEEIMDVDDGGQWSYRSERSGILIVSREIRTIEFMKEL